MNLHRRINLTSPRLIILFEHEICSLTCLKSTISLPHVFAARATLFATIDEVCIASKHYSWIRALSLLRQIFQLAKLANCFKLDVYRAIILSSSKKKKNLVLKGRFGLNSSSESKIIGKSFAWNEEKSICKFLHNWKKLLKYVRPNFLFFFLRSKESCCWDSKYNFKKLPY